MGPVITIMVGRIEDWLRVLVERDGTVVHPAALAYSGVAVFKRAYRIFEERGFRARLLAAAIRHHLHWSEFIGGDVVITLPSAWQKKFNSSRVKVRRRMDDPVDPAYIDELRSTFPDFERAYEPNGLSVDDFD
jgi:transaldolase